MAARKVERRVTSERRDELVLIPLTKILTASTDDRADSARTRPDKKKSPVSLAGLNR